MHVSKTGGPSDVDPAGEVQAAEAQAPEEAAPVEAQIVRGGVQDVPLADARKAQIMAAFQKLEASGKMTKHPASTPMCAFYNIPAGGSGAQKMTVIVPQGQVGPYPHDPNKASTFYVGVGQGAATRLYGPFPITGKASS